MNAGFVSAVGTPLDKDGNLLVDCYKRQIEDQIKAGAVGILSMGSMGQQAYMTNEVCTKVAETAVEVVAGRVPVYVGAMDCSIARTKERIAAMEHIDTDGFVFTTPFYNPCSRDQVINYYKGVAAATKKPILLYDLPTVTQAKITYDMVLEMLRDIPNLIGMKSADHLMFRKLMLNPDVPKDFLLVFSGLDMFDIAYKWGMETCLDGMMSCTPKNSKLLFDSMAARDFTAAATYLSNIVALRDCFFANDLWPCYTVAMNLLGYEGYHGPDYASEATEKAAKAVRDTMVRIGELE